MGGMIRIKLAAKDAAEIFAVEYGDEEYEGK